MHFKKYLLNCFLLLIPILVWNILLVDHLPEYYHPDIFWNSIPGYIRFFENALRFAVMGLPAIMILSLETSSQKLGLGIYLFGLAVYFLSWILIICLPGSGWSQSILGFSAPAYTSIIWLAGIGLIGNRSFFKIKNLFPIYISISVLFVVFHSLHTFIVFQRI